jgi:Ca-activated chloride channel family protein
MSIDELASLAGAFHFLRPAWLLLLPLAWLLHHLLARRHSAEHAWRGIIAGHLLPHLVVNRTPGWRQRLAEPRLALTLLLALAGLALAGPSWQREAPPFVEDRAPLVIALDLGPQMNRAEPAPLGPTRLARAQQKVRALLELRRGARTALIVYAGSAHIVLPLTDDTAILASYVAHLRSDLLPAGGKNSPTALALAEQLLASESAPGTVLLISDGIETALPAPVDTAPLRLLWQVGAGETAMGGIETIPVRLDDDDVAEVQRRVQSHLEAANAAAAQTRWVDAGYWLLWPLLLLAALGFRRGWTVRW